MELKTELPEGFETEYEDGVLRVSGDGSEVSRELEHSLVDVEVQGKTVVFSTDRKRSDIKSIVKTFQSHLENIIEGLKDEHVYEMKGVYAHFPMTVKQEGDQVLIENFMGERNPREVDIPEGVTVEINGEDLTIKGADKEKVGMTAGRIEQTCGKGNRDPRTFQDGVYITSKGGED